MTIRNARRRYALPSLDPLPAFEAAARTLSFTRAAEELFITQSAVSKQIKQIEEQLGVTLFERRSRALVLTEAGYELSRAVTDALDRLQVSVDRLQPGGDGTEIVVTMTTSFASLWLIPRLDRFRALHPEVDVRISATTTLLDLARNRIDVAIRICPPHLVPPDSVRLFDADVVAICSPRLIRLRKRSLADPAEILSRYTLLRCDAPELRGTFMDWQTWFTTFGLGDRKPASILSFNRADQAIQAALAGQGIALAQSRLVADRIASGELVAPLGSQIPGARSFYLVRIPARSQHATRAARVSAFVDWLIQESSMGENAPP